MQQNWEDSIIERLTQKIEWCGVLPYPERPANYFLKHNLGEILVRYDGTKYNPGDATEHFQERNVSMELVFVFRNLRGKEQGVNGLYHAIDAVRDALYMYKLPYSTSGVQFVSEDMIGEDKGIWQYSMKLSFKSVYVAPVKQDLQISVAEQITVISEGHGCTFSGNG